MPSSQRIVSLISSATEILYLLGLSGRVVGVSHECDFPPAVAAKPRLTRSLVEATAASRDIDLRVRTLSASCSALYAIDVEQLTDLAPDLIITQAQCDVCAVRYEDVVAAVESSPTLRQTRVLALNPYSLADVFADIAQIGEATDRVEIARDVVSQLQARVRAVETGSAAFRSSQIPRVCCLEWIDPPMLAANWTPELVTLAGGEPGLTAAGSHSTYADWQQIVAYDPEVFVIMPCGFNLQRTIVEAQVLAAVPGWLELAAVRQRRVFAVDGNAYFNRSGPRLVDSLEILSHLFHPGRFAPPHAAQQAWQRLDTCEGALLRESP